MSDDDLPAPPDDSYFEEQPPTERPRREKVRGDSRVPPHNFDAEQAVIGALLLSADTTSEAVFERVAPGDFYRPQHAHIVRAVAMVRADGGHVDVVTVAEQLRGQGLLDEVGGTQQLVELQNMVPSVSAVGQYAQAVADTAMQRRLISSAAAITEAAYRSATPLAAFEAANQLLDEIGNSSEVQQVSTLDVADFDTLLANGLQPPEPDFMTRNDGGALLYAGKMHAFQAEPSSGKTWVALWVAIEVLNMGGAVLFLDYEDTAVTIYQRLMAMGAEADAVRERFRYVQPSGAYGVAERAQLARILDELNPDLVIIDGVAEALQRQGLSEDSASDFVAWTDLLPRPLARTGAAVVMIDHLVKDKEQQGRYARGTGAKLAVVDGATYSVRVLRSFSRTKPGSVRLTVAKDKPGGVGAIGEHAAVFNVEPHADGERVMCTLIKPPQQEGTEGGAWSPTRVMARVSRIVFDAGDTPMSAAEVKRLVPGKASIATTAIQRLLMEGYVREEQQGRKKVLRAVRPYHDPETPVVRGDEPPPDPVPPEEQLQLPGEDQIEEWLAPPPWETNPEEFE